MTKIWGIIIFIICVTLAGCSQKDTGMQQIELDKLKNADGGYEFADAPLGKSVKDVEKALNVELGEPAFTTEDTATYNVQDVYELDGHKVKMNLEFHTGKLQLVMLTMSAEKEELQETFSKISETLTALYGEADESIQNERDLSELNGTSLSTAGHKWVASNGGQTSSIQLIMMISDKPESSISLGIGLLPSK